MYMNGIKLFVKKEEERETQVQTIRISSQDIGIKKRRMKERKEF